MEMGCVGCILHQEQKPAVANVCGWGTSFIRNPFRYLKITQEGSNMVGSRGSGKRDRETCALYQLRRSLAGSQNVGLNHASGPFQVY